MPNVVVAGGVIQCKHGGQIKLSSGSDKLVVNGAGAITFGMEAGLSFAPLAPGVIVPCNQQLQSPPGPSPCTSSPATAGVSTIMTIGGVGVLLSSAQGLCVNPADASASWSIGSPGETVLSVSS